MIVFEQIADEIRAVLTAEVDPAPDVMRDLDQRYRDLVNETNERLRSCSKLLDSGLRNEAIQKCEAEPNLLEVVALLDIPEFDVWANYTKQFGLPGPRRVQTSIAEQLNDTYNEVASLANLLRQHRLHALLNSPLPTRLKILRKLAHRDSGTPIWLDDIRTYEEVRHNQLKDEIKDAFEQGDLKKLAALEQEVRSNIWTQPPSQTIVQSAIRLHTQLRVNTARGALNDLVDRLRQACKEFDIELGRKYRAQWNAQAAIAIDDDNDPLLERAAPSLEWIAKEDLKEQLESDFQSTVREIELALEDSAPRQTMERLNSKLRNHERNISPVLSERIDERFLAIEAEERRRFSLKVLAIVSVLALIGGVVAWGIYSYQRANVFDRYVAGLQQLVANGNIDQAKAYLKKLESDAPDAFASAEIQSLAAQANQSEQTELGRQARLAQFLAAAQESGKTWDGYNTAGGNLRDADEIAVNDFERAEIARARHQVEVMRQEMQREYDVQFSDDLKKFAQQCERVDKQDLAALKVLIQSGDLLAKRPRVSAVLTAQVPPLVTRLQSQRETTMRSFNEAELIASIDRSVGDRQHYENALTNYVEAFPQKTNAHQMQRVLQKELKTLDSLQAWNAFIANWRDRDMRYQTSQSAKGLIAEAEAMLQRNPGFPGVQPVQEIVDYLTPITRRVDDDGRPAHASLTALLNENIPSINMVLVFKRPLFYRYYSKLGAPLKRNVKELFRLDYFVDTGFTDTRTAEIVPDQVRNRIVPDTDPIEYELIAPQTRFSQLALERLAAFTETKWESEFYQLLLLLDDYPDMAPQVRVQLLGLLLDLGCSGSQPMKVAFAKHLQLIEATPINQEPIWVDPDSVEGRNTLTTADRLLGMLGFRTLDKPVPQTPIKDTALQAADLLHARQQHRIAERFDWVGWLRKDERSKWAVILKPNLQLAKADLYLVFPDDEDKPIIEKFATTSDGQIQIPRESEAQLAVGRPVFVVIP